MATKWRSRFNLSMWALLFTFGISGILALFSYGNSYVHRDYFHTEEFRSELDQFADNLNTYELNNVTLEEAKQLLTVSEDDIVEYRKGLGSMSNLIQVTEGEYQAKIDDALRAGNDEAANVYRAESQRKIKEISSLFYRDESAKAMILSEKEKRLETNYKEREQSRAYFLRYRGQFQYYFSSDLTDHVYTNLSLDQGESATDEMNATNMLFITTYSLPSGQTMNWSPAVEEWSRDPIPFKGQIGVSKDLAATSPLMLKYSRYQQVRITLLGYAIASAAALIAAVLFMKKAVAPPSVIERFTPYSSKLPIDVRVACLILTSIITVILLGYIHDQFSYLFDNPFYYGWNMLIGWLLASVLLVIMLIQGQVLAIQVKQGASIKSEWEQALLNKARLGAGLLYRRVKQGTADAFLNRSLGVQTLMLLMIVFVLGLAAMMMNVHPAFILCYIVLLVLIGAPVVWYIMKSIGYLNRIVVKTNELAVGKLGQDMPLSGRTALSRLAANINGLQQGVKMLQNEQVKSERLKTELITNVSHDLRTPLTSIITYTDLLKKADLSREEQLAYIDILDQKSKRLKVLIDDLFEVSKMASGNIELVMEKVDLVQLLQQTLAEHDNQISDSSLQFRFTKPDEPVYAYIDGQKLWRVFDNLIGNILKYALEHSRAYITLHTLHDRAVITLKNVSKYEIQENMDELFERFKRGDASRHTEGSGLGLAIAKSIVDLHEGSLDIETDGDLFKVIITLPRIDS